MRKLLIAALAAILSGLPAQAASILDPLLGAPGDCYARSYDRAHLDSHRRQRVTDFAIGYDNTYQDDNFELTLLFRFNTRTGGEYVGVGLCSGNVCRVEGDGGAFSLRPYRDGLLLEVDERMGAEGPRDYVDLGESDDTEFLLYPAPASACR